MIRTFAAGLIVACLTVGPAFAEEPASGEIWRHGSALLETPKYPPGFKHFDYVNPNAPKGGLVRLGAQGTFDSFNIVVAGVKGAVEQGIGLIYETLTTGSLDEPSAAYGLLAEAFAYPDDFSSVTFRLRPEARWHDGQPVTAEDVIYSFERVQSEQPDFRVLLRQCRQGRKGGRA